MRRLILAVFLVLVLIATAQADYKYSYEWPSPNPNHSFAYDISWSFTVPSLLALTTTIQAADLDYAYTTYTEPIGSVRFFAPLDSYPGVQTIFEDDSWFANIGYAQPFDAPGTYLNGGIPDNGTLTISSVPEPSLMVLLGISIAGVVGLRRWWKD